MCKYCFSILRDKLIFVINFKNVKSKFRSTILHKEMNISKFGKLIQMNTGYFLRWQTSYHSFPGPQLSKMAVGQISHPGDVQDRMSNSLPKCTSLTLIPVGYPPPPPHLLHPGVKH